MPHNLDRGKKSHSYLCLRFSLTNFCSSLGKEKMLKQIDAAFETWQSVCGLKFKRVEPDEDCEIKITSLNNHDNQIDCPYKLNGQKAGFLPMHFTLAKDKFVEIFTLKMRTGLLKKQNQVMENTIYFHAEYMN